MKEENIKEIHQCINVFWKAIKPFLQEHDIHDENFFSDLFKVYPQVSARVSVRENEMYRKMFNGVAEYCERVRKEEMKDE